MSHIIPSLRTQSPMDVPPSSDKGKEEDVSISVSLEQEPLEVALIDTLPIEILAVIFRLATNNGKDQNTLCRMREVSRFWHQLIEGSAEDEDLFRYGLLSSLWNKFKGEIQYPLLKERISLIDRSVSRIITLPDDDSCDEESVLFLDSTHFSHFQDLSRELTGTPRLLGFEAAPYEEMQRTLDTSLEQIWPRIRYQIDFAGAPKEAQPIRRWLNDPANAEKIARVTNLNLAYMSLKVLPPEIGKLSQLKYFILAHKQLRNLPEWIGNFSQLINLSVNQSELTSLPESIGNLSRLTNLNLGGNHLTSLPESIGNLSQLTELLLMNNQLASLPESIGNLSRLTRLDLFKNRIASLPETIGNLFRLTSLDLMYNRLTALPESIGNLSQLTELPLSDNLLLFMLAKDFQALRFTQYLPYQVIANKYLACSSYVCQLPLASLCQEIHRGKEDVVLRTAFANLSDELQQEIRQAWSAIHSSSGSSSEAAPDLFADRASLTKAIITVLQNRWNALTADQRRQTYAQVAILAGQPQADANWGEAHAEDNIIRLIDAMELVTQQ